MTLVMDGVRGGGVVRARAQKQPAPATARPSRSQAAATEVRLPVGMDGLRHTKAPVEQPPAAAAPAVAVAPQPVTPADIAAVEPVYAAPEVVAPPSRGERLPRWHWDWKRPAMAAGFAITTLAVSAVAVHAISAPRSTTANAEAVAHTAAPSATPRRPKNGLQPLLNNFAAGSGGNYGIVVKDLKTGETASFAPNKQMESASLYKLFVAQRIYQRIDLGQLKITQPAGGGSGQTVGQCLTVMINISDNTCGRALGDILDWGEQDEALDAEGYTDTDLATPQQTTAADVARLLQRLYQGTLLSPDSTNRFLSLLKDQRVNNRLPMGLPAGTVIAHKTGDLDNYVHDAGIVYGPQTDYLVVVMSGPWTAPGNAPAAFAQLSQQLWNYFEQ